jgi:hypothetical protein
MDVGVDLAGNRDFLLKPFSLAELKDALAFIGRDG